MPSMTLKTPAENTGAPPPPKAKVKPAPKAKPAARKARRKPRKKPAPRALKPLVDYVCRAAGVEDARTRTLVVTYCAVIIASAVTFAKKQKDYGPENIAGGGSLGVLIRARDKVERLLNLAGKDGLAPTYEAKSDSALDLHVYGAILWMTMKGLWPGVSTDPRLSV